LRWVVSGRVYGGLAFVRLVLVQLVLIRYDSANELSTHHYDDSQLRRGSKHSRHPHGDSHIRKPN
jgi:hypothetical protein